MAGIIEHDGKLAVSYGRHVDWDRPVYREQFIVSDIWADGYLYLIGCQIEFSGNYGRIYRAGAPAVTVDATSWQWLTVETPVPPKRDGREYTHVWACGQWQREYFPRCPKCYHYHDPALPYCDKCGHCHKPGRKCREV